MVNINTFRKACNYSLSVKPISVMITTSSIPVTLSVVKKGITIDSQNEQMLSNDLANVFDLSLDKL